MEQTTTETPVEETTGGEIHGVAVDSEGRALTAEEPQPEATGTEAERTQPEATTEEPSAFDDDTRSWAESKGLDLSSPEGIAKAISSYREAEKQLHKSSQERSELEKLVNSGTLNPQAGDNDISQLQNEVQQLKLQNQVTSFYMNNPDAKDYDAKMAEIVTERPHLAGDLDALYALARVQSGTDVTKGGKEALEKLANSQRAAVSTGASTKPVSGQTDKITPQNVDQMVAAHDNQWFIDHYDEINQAMAG